VAVFHFLRGLALMAMMFMGGLASLTFMV